MWHLSILKYDAYRERLEFIIDKEDSFVKFSVNSRDFYERCDYFLWKRGVVINV